MSPADARTLFASPSDRHADAVWDGLRREAEHVLRAEPALATLVVALVLAPPRFETGAWVWARRRFFGSWHSTLVSMFSLWILALVLPPL